MDANSGGLHNLARTIRRRILELSHHGKTAHIGSCLSAADILAAIYGGSMNICPDTVSAEGRDRVVFGKGHAAAALLSVLMERGFLSREFVFSQFNRNGGALQEHPGPNWGHGVEIAAGSLGHALPIGVGLAMAARIRNLDFRVCVVIGDGECNEGSVWEAAMFAGGRAEKLANLAVIVDANQWQGIGRTAEIAALEPLADKWKAFGWHALEVNGHDVEALARVLAGFGKGERPTAIIARTVKGKGVSFMEDDNNWHYRSLSDGEKEAALDEVSPK